MLGQIEQSEHKCSLNCHEHQTETYWISLHFFCMPFAMRNQVLFKGCLGIWWCGHSLQTFASDRFYSQAYATNRLFTLSIIIYACIYSNSIISVCEYICMTHVIIFQSCIVKWAAQVVGWGRKRQSPGLSRLHHNMGCQLCWFLVIDSRYIYIYMISMIYI